MKQGTGFKQIIGSVLAAAFGVQSSANRERDFKQGKAQHFIVAGILFTALFVGSLIVVVNLAIGH